LDSGESVAVMRGGRTVAELAPRQIATESARAAKHPPQIDYRARFLQMWGPDAFKSEISVEEEFADLRRVADTVSSFADTSFLFAFYFPRAGSEQAIAKVESLQDAPLISPLIRYEFQQALWFKVWMQSQGQPFGLSESAAQSALAAFDLDIEKTQL
jgi:hypothetical protein